MSAMYALEQALENGCSGYPGVQGRSGSGSGSGSGFERLVYHSHNCYHSYDAKNSSGIGVMPTGISRGSVPINKAGL